MKLVAPVLTFLALLALSRIFLGAYDRTWRSWLTDLGYWLAYPLFKPIVGFFTVVLALPALTAAGLPLDERVVAGHGPVALLPPLLQGFLALLVIDLWGYWMHRVHHGPLWRSHAVHHSSERLDWVASLRVHPLNAILQRAPMVVALLLLGFDLRASAGGAGIAGLYGLLVHARVDWAFGPLRYVLVSPRFHRWHHSPEVDCNYAGILPIWDLIFGTFYLPERGPERFGVRGEPLPEGLLAQLRYGFQRDERR
jgi:sterol desaturase/sphingolipid hydroxylase (fatty acid hydroxylase superfamily)